MENVHPLLFFIVGILVGVSLYPLARLCDSQGVNALLDLLGRVITAPFRLFVFIFRRRPAVPPEDLLLNRPPSAIDPREQEISDAASVIRGILLVLASAIQRTEQVAADSNQLLSEVRETVEKMNLPPELAEVNTQLLHEIDRVVSSNAALKKELATHKEMLEEQRLQIENLKTAVRIDSLTQLGNRAYLDEKIAEAIALYNRYREPFSLLMIDIDNFKTINDTLGHQGGDRVLKGIAFKIKNTLRESDFVGRYGGDEFGVILVKATGTAACETAWKLSHEVRASRFLLDGIEIKATLSIGVAEITENETAASLMKRADRALYKVKDVGRNGVVLADKPSHEPPVAEG